ncbi:hypothetical protein GCWU000246_00244 [Jonquetella anthropi E3_33 E1]|nr:hypothetical protein GCWU000246_00244 [Jonquetella anthropi E3_33 E1]
MQFPPDAPHGVLNQAPSNKTAEGKIFYSVKQGLKRKSLSSSERLSTGKAADVRIFSLTTVLRA